ncbi:MAG: hypothetical protein RL693_1164, partial [Verrucomicrobiota bacterium]
KRAGELLKAAVIQHPDHALLIWQLALYLESQHDVKAVEEMARAVALEKSTARRSLWFGELMKAAAVQGREDLLLTQTRKLLDEAALSAEQRLRYARQALPLKLIKTAEAMLQQLDAGALSTDGSVELALLQAEVMHAKGQTREAGLALDSLLGRLASDYWRKHEILMVRLDLSTTDERDGLVEQARSRWKNAADRTEANALYFADVLEAAHRSHESLLLLQEAAQLLPQSRAIESRLIDRWDGAGVTDEALKWLDSKIKSAADREYLVLIKVRWLFALNKSGNAMQEWSQLIGKLTVDQQVERSMELARWLRRRNQVAESAGVLEAVLPRATNRWELRRELAELYLAQQRREDAVKLFAGDWNRELANDARLEIAQFLLSKQWWAEAKAMLAPWLAQQAGAFDAILLMARIHEKLGEDGQVELMLDQARALCDTDMRYQAWLTTAWNYAESRELQEAWLNEEAARLSTEAVDNNRDANFARWVALIELAQSHREEKLAESFLNKAGTMTGLAEDKKQHMEKLRLEILSADASRATETEAGLRKLLQTDAGHADDCRLRLILFYQKMQRPDLATELINDLDTAKCNETAPLRAVITLLQEQGAMGPALACAERLTRLEPGDRAIWSQWMSLLVQNGREDQLQYALRQVMSRAQEWKLKPEVMEDLRKHLLASHWRGILHQLSAGEEGWAESRRAAAELSSLDLTQEQRRWADWLIATLSGRLGDDQAVQDVLDKFQSLDEKQWIPFPDGMELSVAQARSWLKSLLKKQAIPIRQSLAQGPLAPFSLQWGFALDENLLINKVLLSKDARLVYLCDDRQQIYALDCRSGKLRWKLNSATGGSQLKAARLALPASRGGLSAGRLYNNNGQPEMNLPVSLDEADHHLCYTVGDQVICVRSDTGELLWKNNIGDASSGFPVSSSPPAKVAISGAHVVVWQSAASMVSALHLESGKLAWHTRIPTPPVSASNANSGWGGYDPYAMLKASMNVQDGMIFVAHQSAALLRLDDGAVLWRLSSGITPDFPIELSANDEDLSPGISMTSVSQPFIISGYPGYSNNSISFQRMSGMNNRRWTYGTSMSAALQEYNPGYTLMQGDQIWTFGGAGTADVSMMGLPMSQLPVNGSVVGFAGDSLICRNGQSVDAVSCRKRMENRTLLPPFKMDEPASKMGDDNPAVAIKDRRLYESRDDRLRAADVRNGTVLFDVPLPEEAKAWKKTFVKDAAPMSISGYAMRQQDHNRRSYLP